MKSTLQTPLLIGGATVTTAGGAFIAHKLSSPEEKKSISDFLSEDRSKRLIDDSEVWDATWKEYKKSGEDVWKLGSEASVPNSLKTTCKDKLNSKISGIDSKEYKDFLNYCTRDTLVSDLIKDSGKKLLVKGSGNEAHWVAVWTAYVDDSRNKGRTKGNDIWRLNDWDSKNAQKNSAPSTFMAECESNSKKPFFDVRGALYLDTLKFCTQN
ncbi:hypothetical protein HF1_12270 [Mycoplasma haemofelis str. Langford 1]|uniref:Uncharacterized protein n=1 Tax=Mycoplasma haemofelis (strain Langford 1) TaxID=941640 RepID=E8ZJB4_MYCHL|nr:hypothetical protein [Mycoplasma haemofelis]CBY93235.1 hypothetical protein HF1_12270 [Mycoplasma haemofelis str. Langford 1]